MSVAIQRRSIPIGVGEDPASEGSLPCQYEWGAHIPRLHRVLADPQGNQEFPSPPRDADHSPSMTAYWEACYYFLVVVLGWQDPGRGLEWYLETGRQSDDFHMAVIRELFDRDGQMAAFGAWLWSGGRSWNLSDLRNLQEFRRKPETPREWWDGRRVEDPSVLPPPAGGDSNSLHLGHSLFVDHQPPDSNGYLLSSQANRSATVVLSRMAGWYYQLSEHGRSLPNLGHRSWHVDVVVRPVGWLGTFRQSRITGLWFAGKHSVHMAGQPDT